MPDPNRAEGSIPPDSQLVMDLPRIAHPHAVAEQPDQVEGTADGGVLVHVIKAAMIIIGFPFPDDVPQR